MKLRTKTTIILSSTYLPLLALLYLVCKFMLINNYSKLETRELKQNMARVINMINIDTEGLDDLAYDWSAWDDTYHFVENSNKAYLEANLVSETFTSLKLHTIAIYDTKGNVAYAQSYDSELEAPGELHPSMRTLFKKYPQLLEIVQDKLTHFGGIMQLGNETFIASLWPILQSNEEGPSRGMFVMARQFDQDYVKWIEDNAALDVSIMPCAAITNKAWLIAKEQLSQLEHVQNNDDAPVIVKYKTANNNVVAFAMIRETIKGSPALIIRIEQHRDLYLSGIRTLHYMMLCMFILGIIIYLIMLNALDRGILRRFIKLCEEVNQIGKDKNINKRLTCGSTDELSALEVGINSMLDNLEDSEHELRASELKYRSFIQHFSGIAFRFQPDGTPLYFHGAVRALTGYQEQDLLAQKPGWLDIIAAEETERVNNLFQTFLKERMDSCYVEYKIERSDGEHRWLNMAMQRIEFDGQHFIQGTCIDVTERHNTEAAYIASQQALARLATYLQDTREQERTRIAERIHDEFGQLLLACKINMVWCARQCRVDAPNIAEKAKESAAIIDKVLESIQTLSLELKPSILDRLGLKEALEWQVENDLRKNGISCSLFIDHEVAEQFSSKQKTALFRIAQEGIANIIRHSHADTASISLKATPNEVTFSIVDNGIGIAKEQGEKETTFGILQMRERAAACGGKIVLQKCEESGTEVLVMIPRNQ